MLSMLDEMDKYEIDDLHSTTTTLLGAFSAPHSTRTLFVHAPTGLSGAPRSVDSVTIDSYLLAQYI